MDDIPLSLDITAAAPADNPVSIDTGAQGNPLPSSSTADIRAKKTSISLGEILGKSEAELRSSFARGDEQQIRTQAAQRLDAMNEQSRQDQLIQMVKNSGQTLTIDQMEALRKPPTDPNSVLEDGYASKFLNDIYKAGSNIGDTALDGATVVTPDAVSVDLAKGTSAFSNIEYAKTKQQNIQDLYTNQGYVPWALDQAKSMFPGYQDFKMRGWMEGVPALAMNLEGENLYQQTRAMLRLPGPEFRKKLDFVLDKLGDDNPTLALQYSNAVVGMSTSEQGLASLNTLIDATAIPGLTKGAIAAVKNINTVRGAIRDGIKAGDTIRPTPGAAADGFGDTATAAVQRTSALVQDKIDGVYRPAGNTTNLATVNDPIRQAKEALPTNFILDKEDIAANPGPLSRELTNRILQQQDVASNRIVSVIENTAHVQRIPLEEATTAVMTIVKEEVKNQHPGIKNAILDVGDPVWNPIGKNYNFPVRIGSWTGEQFSSPEVAAKFAEEHGIISYELAGKGTPTSYIPEVAIRRDWETTPRLGEVTFKNGELKVHDDAGAEIQQTHKPQIGHIPITVDPNGKVTFHPTIKTSDEVTKAVTAQQGLGYHLLTWKPLDETQHILKELTLQLQSTKSSASRGGVQAWANSVFGYARSSDNTLSPFEIHQRKTATYSVSNYQHLLQAEMKHVEDIARGRVRVDEVTGQDIPKMQSYMTSLSPANKLAARQRYAEFSRTLDAARDWPNPDTGKPGYFFRSPLEINNFYQTNFQRNASFQEIQGYHAFVRNYENDRVLRSLRMYTNKVRLGAEQHTMSFLDESGNKYKSEPFDGVTKKELPGGSEYPILDMTGQKPRINLSSKFGNWKEMVDSVRKGENVVSEIFDPELRPFKTIPGVGNSYVRYAITRASDRETQPLNWNQVNRLSGGHFDYDHGQYLKEARVRQDVYGKTKVDRYEGDTTFMALESTGQGKRIAQVLNEVKKQLRAKDVPQAKKVFQEGLPGANGPAMEWKDFYSRTHPTKDTNGVLHPPQININEPFMVVPKGRNIIDLGGELQARYAGVRPNGTKYDTFQDGTKSGSLARQYQVNYTQERDNEGLKVLRAEGTPGNPIYKYEPARFVDPITTMNRALNQIVASTFMDDMKIAGIETWLREAEPILKKEYADLARSAPYHVFNSADSADAFAKAGDRFKIMNLLSNRFKTKQFLGVPSKYDLFMHDTADKVATWMYESGMQDKLGDKLALTPSWLINNTTSPIRILRAIAYHAKIGLLALPQVFTQLQSYVTIASVSPRSAAGGTWAATLHQWSRVSRSAGVMDELDKAASWVNLPGLHRWKPGQFKEAMIELDNRGFANVGKEYGMLDNQLKHQWIKGEAGAFLDASQVFFKNTEQHVRFGSWYTATLEYRAENPGITKMSRTDWDKVLDRADDLSGNMSRASSSIMQSGPMALTGQFLTYQMHLAEFFWGKRIAGEAGSANAARARMAIAYTLLCGVPMGIGITGLPLADYIRKAATDNGYVVGDNWVTSCAMEGLPACYIAWATGDDEGKNGNWYNLSKFGAGGFTQFNELMSSDAKLWHFLGGASGSIFANSLSNSYGFYKDVSSMLTGKSEDQKFKFTSADWIDVVKEVTSVNQTWKGIMAVTTGKWYSKNEAYQADVSKANGIFMAATGIDLTNAADNYNIGQMVKEQTEAQKGALNLFIKEFRRGILAADNNDPDNYKTHMTKAFLYLDVLGYPEDKKASAVAIASKGYETRVNSIREEFYTKNVPAGKEDQRMDAYTRFLKTQDK